MRDPEIRKSLHDYLEEKNISLPDTIVIDELDVCKGLARVDVAVVNGVIHGYEIKSKYDTLQRLPNQIKYYNKSLEKVTITLNSCHLDKSLDLIPEWWGILIIDEDNSENKISEFRIAEINESVDPDSLLQLLWKDELLSLLNKYNFIVKSNLSKIKLRENIIRDLDTDLIKQEVRQALKLRKNWRN